jgi:hypothetical protein
MYNSDLLIEEPYHTTVAIAAYDAVVYYFTINAYEFEFDSENKSVTGLDGKHIRNEPGRYGAKAVFFYSNSYAYYMIFRSTLDDYDRLEPEFEELLASITVDDE